MAESGPRIISPVDFHDRSHPSRARGKGSRFRWIMLVLFVTVFGGLVFAAWFVLTARNVHLTFKPEPERVELRVRAERPAWLVLSDTPYPGWEATVDGRTAPILSANVACRAVRVPAGESRVVMRYRPGSFRRGAASCGLGLLALVLMLMRRRRGGARERR